MRNAKTVLAVAAGLIVAGSATAGEMTLERTSGSGGWVTAQLGGTNASGNVAAGRFEWEVTAASGDVAYGVGDTVYTFCTELAENVSNTQTFDQTGLGDLTSSNPGVIDGTRQARLEALYANHYSGTEVVDGSSETYNLGSMAGASAVVEAAFQFAVWEIVYGDDLDLVGPSEGTDGFFIANVNLGNASSARTQAVNIANTWLAGLDDAGGSAALAGLLSIDPADGQDMIVVVPLPAAALLGVAGLGLAARARRSAARLA